MKNLKFLFSLLLVFSITATVNAQSTFRNRNVTEGVVRALTTTDSTAFRTIDSLTIGNNEAGFAIVHLVGFNDSAVSGLTGIKQVRYIKKAGTLTLGTVSDLQTTVVDTEISPANWQIVAVNNNLYVKVKGAQNITVVWSSVIQSKSIRKVQ